MSLTTGVDGQVCRLCNEWLPIDRFRFRPDRGRHDSACRKCANRRDTVREREKRSSNAPRTILVFNDLHMPFQHPDALHFLKDVRDWCKPDVVVSNGDEGDLHMANFHGLHPSAPNADTELDLLRAEANKLFAIFPEVLCTSSNHMDRMIRRFIAHNCPTQLCPTYKDILKAPEGWLFGETHQVDNVVFKHGDKTHAKGGAMKAFNEAMSESVFRGEPVCVMMGHEHSRFEILQGRWGHHLVWGGYGGCLVDLSKPAFAYHTGKPVALGCTVIRQGVPQLVQMKLDKSGRWTGKL